MSEMFATVNANAEAVQRGALRRKENTRRHRQANRRMLGVLVSAAAVWLLVIVLRLCGQLSTGLAEFLATWAGAVLAIWFGAWIQFRFCKGGLMK